MKTKWISLEESGLPPPGVYLFKNEKTEDVMRAVVRGCPNGSCYIDTGLEKFNDATHWTILPEPK